MQLRDVSCNQLPWLVGISERALAMESLLDNAVSHRKLFGILSALSMLLISGALSSRSLGKAVPKFDVVERLQPIAAEQDGAFEKVWVEHDVRVDGKKGMRIHARFTVKNSLNVECTLVAHFYTKEGAQLTGADLQGNYSTSDGHVVTYVKVTPRFNSSRYSDKSLFIPYREFNIKRPGLYLLKFILYLERYDRGDQILAKSTEVNFKYTKS